MTILIVFAFLAGIITVLSPCILPVLPIVLSGATIRGKRYPLGIVLGFVLSFTFFTLFLTTLVNLTGISANALRNLSIVIIFLFGLVLVVPELKKAYQSVISKWTAKASKTKTDRTGFGGGLLVGVSLGLIWTPCVGPILASVIALALTGSVSGTAVFITLAYALGTAIPMLLIMRGGRALLNRVPGLLNNLENIQRFFGVLLILVAIAMHFNLDRKFQTYILEKFPSYGTGLTQIEQIDAVQDSLDDLMPDAESLETYQPAPELIPGGEWFNSPALTMQELKGKVVLIDFWTYSCINCIRTLPYIQSWHEKYADQGLVIIGVHTPEFEFEKDPSNLAKAIEDFGLTYPIVQDNDYKTWRSYNNRYWPAKYFIDAQGRIRGSHFGEGDYDESETMIQELLREAGYTVSSEIENETYTIDSRTPETYLGYKRMEGLASPEVVVNNEVVTFSYPETVEQNRFALKGDWLIEAERAIPSADASLQFQFNAKDVFLVMNPIAEDAVGQVEVFLDGESQGIVEVDFDRLYDLIRLDEPGSHRLELKFLDSNIEAYAFTFG